MAGSFELDEPVVEYGLTVGGDGAGQAWSARWTRRNDDGTFTVVTRYFYPVDLLERTQEKESGFVVEALDEFLECTDLDDVGGTARQSECRYTELTGKYGTADAANAEAERRARFCATNQPPDPNEIPW